MTVVLDKVFEGLSNPKRRGIIDTLAYRPATITQLAEEHKLSLPAIHKHIKVLEQAELIQRRKVGRTNIIAFNPSSMSLAQDWINQYRTGWGSKKQTLENYISSLKHEHKPYKRSVK
jgi:DNA-binding transcriptional ArsR family regulator